LLYLETRNGHVRIIKAEFDIDETVKENEQLRKKKLVLIDENVDIRKSLENFIHQFNDKND
jgi:hypothetical protein